MSVATIKGDLLVTRDLSHFFILTHTLFSKESVNVN